jgi:hypothetical protein
MNQIPKNFFINPFKQWVMRAFIFVHLILISFLEVFFKGSFFLAPDEQGYLQIAQDAYTQGYTSIHWGWPVSSPVWFLKLIYLL